jgi:biotin carboxylase
MLKKVLVANRGEIAIRAFRAAYEFGNGPSPCTRAESRAGRCLMASFLHGVRFTSGFRATEEAPATSGPPRAAC